MTATVMNTVESSGCHTCIPILDADALASPFLTKFLDPKRVLFLEFQKFDVIC